MKTPNRSIPAVTLLHYLYLGGYGVFIVGDSQIQMVDLFGNPAKVEDVAHWIDLYSNRLGDVRAWLSEYGALYPFPPDRQSEEKR